MRTKGSRLRAVEPGEKALARFPVSPFNDRVIVRRDEQEEKFGSIILPQNVEERPLQGTVMAVGPGRLLENGVRTEITASPGDRVIFGKFAGQEMKLEGEVYIILREDELFCKLEV